MTADTVSVSPSCKSHIHPLAKVLAFYSQLRVLSDYNVAIRQGSQMSAITSVNTMLS